MPHGLGPLDLAVLAGALVLVTWIGERLAGRSRDSRDFFLGGRKLPWWAVAASVVATEISAVTYVSLPSVVWRPGGDLTYLQLWLFGSLVAKAVVGFVLVPAYFQREIYSPYDYMGARLGPGVQRTTTALFTLGGVLGQAARVYLIAVVLEILLARELAWVEHASGLPPLVAAVVTIGVVSVAWTWMGGIATVVWTDLLLFFLFLAGIATLLFHAAGTVDGGLFGALHVGARAGKLHLVDATPTLASPNTLWAALFAAPWMMLGPYGTDQLIVQRLFACEGAREARRAILASAFALVVMGLVGLVGVALFAALQAEPLAGDAARAVAEHPDRLVPTYALERLPDGLRGLVVAGAFAAAISSLDSILSALAQTSTTLVLSDASEPRRALRVSRAFVLLWGAVLCAVAIAMRALAAHYDSLLDLALAMATYTGPSLIAGFFLAFLPTGRDGRGFAWGAALSILAVVAMAWPNAAGRAGVGAGLALVGLAWVVARRRELARAQSAWLVVGAALVLALARWGHLPASDAGPAQALAYPWFAPIGTGIAFAFGYLLAHRRNASDAAPAP